MAKITVSILLVLPLVSMLVPQTASAQLAKPGPSGVVMGHVHLVVRDLDAHRRFWTTLGGTPTKNGTIEMMAFPGGYMNLRKGEPTGGSAGSVVNHIGFNVKDLKVWLPKWQAAGLTVEQTRPTQVFITGPDQVRVEISEDTTIDVPIRMHHVHFVVPDPMAAQAWYAKTFGAVPNKRGRYDTADLPGISLTFGKADVALAGTLGRSLDHVGFEIIDLAAFVKRLTASGIKLDREYQRSTLAPLALACITDPFGTYLELTEGLTPGTGIATK